MLGGPLGQEADVARQPSCLTVPISIYHTRCCVCCEDTKSGEMVPALKDLIVTYVSDCIQMRQIQACLRQRPFVAENSAFLEIKYL